MTTRLNKDSNSINAEVLALETKLSLPPRAPNKYLSGEDTGWANLYGGADILGEYCGLIPGLSPRFNAAWQHGVHLPWLYKRNPKDLLYYIKHTPDKLILVANEDQKESLSSIGYVNVHAVGSPWIYAQPKNKPLRISDSVLVMPPHTLDNAPFQQIFQLSDYCDYIALKYKNASSFLCACFHMSCIRNEQYAQMFVDAGFKMITGAEHYDKNSLIRMWQIFSQFEVVSTPAVGSHVYYALAAGCKVVIEGPKINYSRDQLLLDVTYHRSIEAGIDPFFDTTILDSETQFEQMFRSPRADKALGLEAVGMAAKKTPCQIKRILGWSRRKQVGQLLANKARSCRKKLILDLT